MEDIIITIIIAFVVVLLIGFITGYYDAAAYSAIGFVVGTVSAKVIP